jgi:hypothetical protein
VGDRAGEVEVRDRDWLDEAVHCTDDSGGVVTIHGVAPGSRWVRGQGPRCQEQPVKDNPDVLPHMDTRHGQQWGLLRVTCSFHPGLRSAHHLGTRVQDKGQP